jgi:hypothetical protein
MSSVMDELLCHAGILLLEVGGCTYSCERIAPEDQHRCVDGDHIWTPATQVFYLTIRGCVVCGLIDRTTIKLARQEPEATSRPQAQLVQKQPFSMVTRGMCVVCGRLLESAWQEVCREECPAVWLGQHFIIFAQRQRLMPRKVAELYERHVAGRSLTKKEWDLYEGWRTQAIAGPHACLQPIG